MQVEAPELLGPALKALADAATPASSVEVKGAELMFEEEIDNLDLGRDNIEKAVSLGTADDDEAGVALELAPVYEAVESKEAFELNLADADEFDIQTEPAKTADHGKIDLEETPASREKKEDDAAAGSSLTLESIELSYLPAEIDAEGKKVTLDLHDDPPDLWSLNASAVDDVTILDKVSVDIFGALELAGQSIAKRQFKQSVPNSESSEPNGKMECEVIEGGEEIGGVLDKVYTEIVDVLKKDKKYSVG